MNQSNSDSKSSDSSDKTIFNTMPDVESGSLQLPTPAPRRSTARNSTTIVTMITTALRRSLLDALFRRRMVDKHEVGDGNRMVSSASRSSNETKGEEDATTVHSDDDNDDGHHRRHQDHKKQEQQDVESNSEKKNTTTLPRLVGSGSIGTPNDDDDDDDDDGTNNANTNQKRKRCFCSRTATLVAVVSVAVALAIGLGVGLAAERNHYFPPIMSNDGGTSNSSSTTDDIGSSDTSTNDDDDNNNNNNSETSAPSEKANPTIPPLDVTIPLPSDEVATSAPTTTTTTSTTTSETLSSLPPKTTAEAEAAADADEEKGTESTCAPLHPCDDESQDPWIADATTWDCLQGYDGTVAQELLEHHYPDRYDIIVLPELSPMTMDMRYDRIRIIVGSNSGCVTQSPNVG